jgi:hypothetical protein
MVLTGIPIPDTQDIGDSLVYINNAFLSLKSKVEYLDPAEGIYLRNVKFTADGGAVYDISSLQTDNVLPANYLVYLDGIKQRSTSDYNIANQTVVFTTSVPAGVNVDVSVAAAVVDNPKLPVAGGTLTGGLTGTTATFTVSVSAPVLSGTFVGDGSRLTGLNVSSYAPLSGATFTGSISAPVLSGTFVGDGSRLTGLNVSSYAPLSGATFTGSVSALVLSGTFVGDGSRLTGLNISSYAPLSGATFVGALSAPVLSGTFVGDGSRLTGLNISSYAPLSGATFTGSVSAPVLSGAFVGDGSRLANINASRYAPLSGVTFVGSVSAPVLSGTFVGDGSRLTGLNISSYAPLSGATFTGSVYTQSLSASNLALTNATVSTFSLPVSANGDFLLININGTVRKIRLWD